MRGSLAATLVPTSRIALTGGQHFGFYASTWLSDACPPQPQCPKSGCESQSEVLSDSVWLQPRWQWPNLSNASCGYDENSRPSAPVTFCHSMVVCHGTKSSVGLSGDSATPQKPMDWRLTQSGMVTKRILVLSASRKMSLPRNPPPLELNDLSIHNSEGPVKLMSQDAGTH